MASPYPLGLGEPRVHVGGSSVDEGGGLRDEVEVDSA